MWSFWSLLVVAVEVILAPAVEVLAVCLQGFLGLRQELNFG
jgi:hypothetical protein